jgi:dUTP pyrophosphatase
MQVRIQRCGPVEVPLPKYQTPGSAGVDLHLATTERVVLVKGGWRLRVPTGLRIAIPEGYEGQVRPRSGLASKHGLGIVNSPGTIDSDYRGEIQITLINLDPSLDIILEPLTRIAQLVICPVMRVEWLEGELDETERGVGGYGSTGT